MSETSADIANQKRTRREEVRDGFVVLVVGALAIGAAFLRTLKPAHAGWFDPERVDEKVFVLLMVPLLWYLLRIAKSLKFNKDGFEFERLAQVVSETKAATEETGKKVTETSEQVAVTHAALTYGVGGGKHLRSARAREMPSGERLRAHASRTSRSSNGPIDSESAQSDDADGGGAESVDVNSDPQKNRWGGLSRRDGRELKATITPIPGSDGLFRVRLEVVPVNGVPITGPVVFHLHPTFTRMDPVVVAENGCATLSLTAWGAFTVGAEVDGGKTQLELDLSTVAGVPEVFASR